MPSIDYEITDICWSELDADLKIGEQSLYFQFSATEGPTIEAALRYINGETKLYWANWHLLPRVPIEK